MQHSLRIGLTGNIGSGKTTVARIFELLNIPVYYADLNAKKLMTDNEEVRQAIMKAFGPAAYQTEDYRSSKVFSLNRQYLADRVFQHPDQLKILNAIVHPAVAADSLRWHKQQKSAYTLYEAAITFETGGYKVLDKVIVVTASKKVRLARVMLRDKSTAEQVEARMQQQWAEEKKIELADYQIVNDGQQLLLPQVLKIHEALKAIAPALTKRTPSVSGN